MFRSFIRLLGTLPEFDFGGSVKVFSYDDSRRQMKAKGATNIDQEIKGPALETKFVESS